MEKWLSRVWQVCKHGEGAESIVLLDGPPLAL